MSSTSAADPKVERLLQKFWNDRLIPAAEALRRRGVRFFDLAPSANAASYFVDHVPSASAFVEIEQRSAGAALKARWAGEGYPELAAIAELMVELGPKLAPKQVDSGDVSPFMYVMF